MLGFGEIEAGDPGSAPFGNIEFGADPVGSGHEVVAGDGDAGYFHVGEELLHLRDILLEESVAEFDVFDGEVAFDGGDFEAEGLDAFLHSEKFIESGAGVADGDVGDADLRNEFKVVIGEGSDDGGEFHGVIWKNV